jgi:hypothetical protein
VQRGGWPEGLALRWTGAATVSSPVRLEVEGGADMRGPRGRERRLG